MPAHATVPLGAARRHPSQTARPAASAHVRTACAQVCWLLRIGMLMCGV